MVKIIQKHKYQILFPVDKQKKNVNALMLQRKIKALNFRDYSISYKMGGGGIYHLAKVKVTE